MLYENKTGKDAKIKILDKREKLGFRWITARVGDVVDIPREVGDNERFTPAKGKGVVEKVVDKITGHKPTEEKVLPVTAKDIYRKKLTDIDGVGERTVIDVMKDYPTEDSLVKAIVDKKHFPWRNDVVQKICDAFAPEEENNEEEKDESL